MHSFTNLCHQVSFRCFTLCSHFVYLTYIALCKTCPPVIWTGKNEYGRVEIWVDGYKNEGAKKFSKTIDIVSYALK